SLSGMSNLCLYTSSAVGRDPKERSGLILALRFGFKALSGLVLGVIAARFGIRAPLITTVCLLGLAAVWPLLAPGYTYLLAFGLMGAGGSLFPDLRGGFLASLAAVVEI